MSQCRFTRRALEEEGLVCQFHGIAMDEVDFHLRRTRFMDEGVDGNFLRFAVGVNVIEQRVELIHCRNAVTLPAILGTPGTTDRRLQRVVRVEVRLDEEELEFRRYHRLPAVGGVEVQHASQHIARRHRHRPAVAEEAVVNDLRRRLGGPRHHTNGAGVGLQQDVDFGRVDGAVVFRVFAGDGLQENGFRQAHALFFHVLFGGHQLAAGHASEVGNDCLHFADTMLPQERADGAATLGRRLLRGRAVALHGSACRFADILGTALDGVFTIVLGGLFLLASHWFHSLAAAAARQASPNAPNKARENGLSMARHSGCHWVPTTKRRPGTETASTTPSGAWASA